MTFQSRNASSRASLELSLTAHKSLLSDYVIRAQQAEAAASRAISHAQASWTDEQIRLFASLIGEQMQIRATERAVQQQAVIQATLVSLNAALQAEPEQQKEILTTMARELTRSVQHLSALEMQEKVKRQAGSRRT
jgi:hypothetical protein